MASSRCVYSWYRFCSSFLVQMDVIARELISTVSFYQRHNNDSFLLSPIRNLVLSEWFLLVCNSIDLSRLRCRFFLLIHEEKIRPVMYIYCFQIVLFPLSRAISNWKNLITFVIICYPRQFVFIKWRRLVISFSTMEVFQWLYSMQIRYQKLFMDFDSITLRS